MRSNGEKAQFVRFVLLERNPQSHRRTGLLVAAHALRDSDELEGEEFERLRALCAWFNKNVNVPKVLGAEGNERALSWFKAGATKPIAKMWEVAAFFEARDRPIEVLRTDDPGMILFEDGWQVVAKPGRGRQVSW
jgi:hypothetical protein